MASSIKNSLDLLRLVAALQMFYSYQFALTGLREPVLFGMKASMLAFMPWHLLEKRAWHFKRCNGRAS